MAQLQTTACIQIKSLEDNYIPFAISNVYFNISIQTYFYCFGFVSAGALFFRMIQSIVRENCINQPEPGRTTRHTLIKRLATAMWLEGVFQMWARLASPAVTGGAHWVSTSSFFFFYNYNYVKNRIAGYLSFPSDRGMVLPENKIECKNHSGDWPNADWNLQGNDSVVKLRHLLMFTYSTSVGISR